MPAAAKKPPRLKKIESEKAISVADAKAHFSSVITRVERKRLPITILRRGIAVAQIVPLSGESPALFGSMGGTVKVLGDIIGPTGEEWTLAGSR